MKNALEKLNERLADEKNIPSPELLAQLAAPILAAMWNREGGNDPHKLINDAIILAKKLHEAAIQQTPVAGPTAGELHLAALKEANANRQQGDAVS
jgi:hypothetical protein